MFEASSAFRTSYSAETSRFIVSAVTIPSDGHPKRNEDFMVFSDSENLAMLFDGSSSSVDAFKASREAGLFLHNRLRGNFRSLSTSEVMIRQGLLDTSVHLESVTPESYTTGVVAKFVQTDNGLFVVGGNIGDSGVDFVAPDTCEPVKLSRDHNLLDVARLSQSRKLLYRKFLEEIDDPEELIKLKEEGSPLHYFFRRRNWVVQRLGKNEFVLPEKGSSPVALIGRKSLSPYIFRKHLPSGSVVILYSDGIGDNLTYPERTGAIDEASGVDLIAHSLANKAYQRSTDDNHPRSEEDDISVMAIYVK